jgi:hypothetical protein
MQQVALALGEARDFDQRTRYRGYILPGLRKRFCEYVWLMSYWVNVAFSSPRENPLSNLTLAVARKFASSAGKLIL